RGDRDHLARGDVHVVDLVDGDQGGLTAGEAAQGLALDEVAVVVERGGRLRDDVPVLVVGGEVDDLVGDAAVLDHPVRGLDETERVDPGEGRQRADQTDVRPLRGLDRAHAAVVRRVDVTDLHTRTVAGQAARTERGQAPLVRQPRQRVVLVH